MRLTLHQKPLTKHPTGVTNLRLGKFPVCFLKTNRFMRMQIFSRVRIVSRLFLLSRFFPYLAVMRFDLINFFYRLLSRHRPYVTAAAGVRLPTLRNHEWTVCPDEWTQQTDLLPVSIEPEACFWQCYKRSPCREIWISNGEWNEQFALLFMHDGVCFLHYNLKHPEVYTIVEGVYFL